MKKVVLKIVINAIGLAIVAQILPGISYENGVTNLLIIALVFGVVNLFVKPLVSFFSLPIKALTLGLFSFVVNGAMLYLVSIILETFTVEGMWFPGIELGPIIMVPVFIPTLGTAIIGSVIIGFVVGVLNWFVE